MWGIPSARQFAKKKFSKGEFFHNMFQPSPKEKEEPEEPFKFDFSKLTRPSPLKIYITESAKDKCEYSVKILVSDMLNEVDLILSKEECEAASAT